MDVLLISPDQGSNYPWGVFALGSYLTNIKGRKAQLLDANALSESEFKQELSRLLPKTNLIGIGFLSSDTFFVKQLVDHIKEVKPGAKIILGGPHVVLEPEQTCMYKNVDFVAYSFGEETIDLLIEELAKDNPRYGNIPGLIYKDNDRLIKTGPSKFVGFYDTNYDLLPEVTRRTFNDYIQIFAGRGCSYRCRFCYNSVIQQKFHPRPAEDIIAELSRIVDRYNPKIVYFRDDNFFSDKQRVYDFIRLYKEKKFTFGWRAACRVNYFRDDFINTQLMDELDSIKCQALKIGVESGSQRVLDYLKKGITVKGAKRMVREIARTKGVEGVYSFMMGLPGETVDEYKETIQLIKYIIKHEPNADVIGPQYFRIYPGGSLYDEIVENYGFKPPQSFEEWAEKTANRDDPFGLSESVEYPWIPRNGRHLPLYGHLLIQLYKKPIRDFITLRRFFMLPLALLAKLRVKIDWYGFPYDIKLISKLFHLDGKISNYLRNNSFLRQSGLLKVLVRQSTS